jgi:hypothetical protein
LILLERRAFLTGANTRPERELADYSLAEAKVNDFVGETPKVLRGAASFMITSSIWKTVSAVSIAIFSAIALPLLRSCRRLSSATSPCAGLQSAIATSFPLPGAHGARHSSRGVRRAGCAAIARVDRYSGGAGTCTARGLRER